jgi:hypothetical protein
VDAQRNQIVQVLLVGGPLHGIRTILSNPEPRMTLEPRSGQNIVYLLARSLEHVASNDAPSATYIREGIAIDELAFLVNDAERNGPWL